MNSIQRITEQAICTGCGTCVSICPQKAINMRENAGGFLYAHVDKELCVQCRRCLNICPSHAENQTIDDVSESLRGKCLQGYIGYASSKNIRREGQSGGIVTALLLYLLESGKIDGAITNQLDTNTNRPKAVFADSAEIIKESAGSYYCQSAVVNTILENKSKRLAAVVLGCQAEAVRLCREKHVEDVRAIEYMIGLICAGQNSGYMMDKLIADCGCTKEEKLQRFRFRYSHPTDGGWPGNILIVTNKYRYRLDQTRRHALKPICESYRCLLCYDQMCIDADVVCGDPWGFPGDHSAGETVIIAHTTKGQELIKEASDAGYIAVRELDAQLIIKGETVDGRHRDKVAAGYAACQKNGWLYPYSVSEKAAKELSSISHKTYRKSLERMQYTRSRFLATDANEVSTLTKKYQEKLKRNKQTSKIKTIVKFPIRCIRYLLKKI